MTEPDRKTTLRDFREYLYLCYASPREFAAQIGVSKQTIWEWLSGRRQPKPKSLAKLRRFLDSEAKRSAQGDGIRPVESVPYKIIRPIQQVRYARLCPFLPEGPGQDPQTRCCFVSGRLPTVWSKWTEARGTPGGNTSLECQRMIGTINEADLTAMFH